jgi:hypothetical protein
MNSQDALEVAKLAAAVGGQLKTIDQFTTERRSTPANRININNFIAKVKNPNASIKPASYLTDTSGGFAPAPPEEYIQMQVPDTSIGSLPSVVGQPSPTLQTVPVTTAPQPKVYYESKNPNTQDLEISSALKSIDKTLADMLSLLKERFSNE